MDAEAVFTTNWSCVCRQLWDKCRVKEPQKHKVSFMKRLFTGNTNTVNMDIQRPPEDQHLFKKNVYKTI